MRIMSLILLLLKAVAECPIAFNWSRIESSLFQSLKQPVILNLCVKTLPFAKFLVLFQAWSHLPEIVFDVFSGSLFSESASECVSVFSNRKNIFITVTSLDGFPIIFENKRGVCDKMLFP